MKKQVQVERESVKETHSSGDEATLQEELPARQRALNFRNPGEREAHIRAFLAWLPKVLHDAPGIDWTRLPSEVMGYLIRSVGDSLDAIPIALAISCAMDGIGNNTLHTYSHQLTSLLTAITNRLWNEGIFRTRHTPDLGPVRGRPNALSRGYTIAYRV